MKIEIREMQTRFQTPGEHYRRDVWHSGWNATLKRLESEVAHLGGAHIVIEVTGPKVEVRRDGHLSANSRLDPEVKVSFISDHGPLMYESGEYDSYRANVHAVVLTLERLRLVDGYGCVKSGQQYTGFAALPQKTADSFDPHDVIARAIGVDVAVVYIDVKKAIRTARGRSHPDRNGGDREAFDLVDRAAQMIEGSSA